MASRKKAKTMQKRAPISTFVVPKDIREKLRKESFETGRSMSEIVREALAEYFSYKTS